MNEHLTGNNERLAGKTVKQEQRLMWRAALIAGVLTLSLCDIGQAPADMIPAATGTSTTSGNANLFPGGLTNLQFRTVDVNAAQTGLYDLNSAINLQSNQSTVVALQYKVDGALVGQPFYETVGSGDFIVSLPSQLNLAPGFHTIGLTAENLFDGTVNVSGDTFQATAYNNITENATPEPATLTLLGSGLLAIGTVRLRRRRQIRLTPSRDDTAIQA